MKGNKKEQDPLKVVGCSKGYSQEELIKNLPRHFNSSPILIEQVKGIPEVVLRNSGTLFAKKVKSMMKEVYTEAYRARQFTRTKVNNRGVLYGVVLLKHRVIDLVLEYFHKRFPKSIICLFNEHTKKTTIIDEKGEIRVFNSSLKDTVEDISINRSIIPYFEDIQFSGEEIFETLYSSQFISERENKSFFKKMIPDKCFELPGMKGGVERRFRNKKINDYL
ncbi:MAG: DUF4130 domain-containing protein [Candidatus Thorarchaeota archaeon]